MVQDTGFNSIWDLVKFYNMGQKVTSIVLSMKALKRLSPRSIFKQIGVCDITSAFEFWMLNLARQIDFENFLDNMQKRMKGK